MDLNALVVSFDNIGMICRLATESLSQIDNALCTDKLGLLIPLVLIRDSIRNDIRDKTDISNANI